MRIKRQALIEALSIPASIASRRAGLPILNSLLLSANENRLTVAGSNIEIYRESYADCEGELPKNCVNAGLLSQAAQQCAEDVELSIAPSGRLAVVSGSLRAQLPVLKSEEFVTRPEQPWVRSDIDCELLAEGVKATSWSTIEGNEQRPNMEGVNIIASETHLECVATNGKTLALYKAESPCSPCEILLPSKYASEAVNHFAGSGSVLFYSDNWLKFEAENGCTFIKRTEERFPNFRHIFPAEFAVSGKVNRAALMDVLDAAQMFTTDKFSSTVLAFSKTGIEVSVDHREGQFSKSVPGEFADMRCAVSGRMLSTLLKSIRDEEAVTISGVDKFTPLVINGGKITALIICMRTPN